eukprot:449724-Amphidinium_carterae.2
MVRMERFAVGQGACLLDEDWLKKGFEVWQTMRRAADLAATTGFLLRPTADGQGVRAEVANYQDAVGYTAAMLAGLKVGTRAQRAGVTSERFKLLGHKDG